MGDDDKVSAYFSALELDPDDATVLFQMLEHDQDLGIALEDFVMGCLRLKGWAKSCDMLQVMYANKNMMRILIELKKQVELHTQAILNRPHEREPSVEYKI